MMTESERANFPIKNERKIPGSQAQPAVEEGLCNEPTAVGRVVADAPATRAAAVLSRNRL